MTNKLRLILGLLPLIGLKTLWKKKKIPVSSSSSFPPPCQGFQKTISYGLLKFELLSKDLTLYHTIQTFNDPEEEGF